MVTDTYNSPWAKVHGIPFKNVTLEDGFWKETGRVCADSTVYHLKKMFDSEEISHVVENFRICAGRSKGRHKGTPFGDGDFYKWMEAALYCAVSQNNEALLKELEDYIQLLGEAQRSDGYLSTKQIIEEMKGKKSRLKDINDFEVYNLGHLFTSACLYNRLTGKDNFLKIAEKAAGYLKQVYHQAEDTGQVQTAVCPSHYMGLVELYRTTGEKEYLELAAKAVRLRDMVENGMDDNQDRIPLLEHDRIVGHAVRANYLYAGLADLYAETGRKDYLQVLHRVWNSLVQKKMYLTGGCGALYNGVSPYGNFFRDQKIHQAYGYEYQLPNITAYNETCASVGGVMWAYRMFTVEPKAVYMDVLERMMYNVNLGAVSLDGKKFFYENMLRRTWKLDYQLVWPRERTEYIESYCCPPNLARLIAQTAEYFYMKSEDSVWIGLYGESTAVIDLDNGAAFQLHQSTAYPYDGTICFTFDQVRDERPWKLMLRVPGWVKRGKLKVNGKERKLFSGESGTYIEIFMERTKGAQVELVLDMPARLTVSNSMVEETENHLAVERGPLVYCMESKDGLVEDLDDLLLPANAVFAPEEYWIQGRKMTALKSCFLKIDRDHYDKEALYSSCGSFRLRQVQVRLIPYFAWDNRGMGQMRIWFPAQWPVTAGE